MSAAMSQMSFACCNGWWIPFHCDLWKNICVPKKTYLKKKQTKKKKKKKKKKKSHLKKKKRNLSFYPFSKSFSAKTLRLTQNHSLPIKQD